MKSLVLVQGRTRNKGLRHVLESALQRETAEDRIFYFLRNHPCFSRKLDSLWRKLALLGQCSLTLDPYGTFQSPHSIEDLLEEHIAGHSAEFLRTFLAVEVAVDCAISDAKRRLGHSGRHDPVLTSQ